MIAAVQMGRCGLHHSSPLGCMSVFPLTEMLKGAPTCLLDLSPAPLDSPPPRLADLAQKGELCLSSQGEQPSHKEAACLRELYKGPLKVPVAPCSAHCGQEPFHPPADQQAGASCIGFIL